MGSFEAARLLRTTLGTSLLLLAVPLFQLVHVQIGPVILGHHPGKEAFWISIAALLILAYTFGQNLFRLERQDAALEYLLTFPRSRWAILAVKTLPRALVLLLLVLMLEAVILTHGVAFLAGGTPFSVLIDPLFLPAWVLILFLLGTGNSLFEQKNLMAVLSMLTFVAWGLAAAAIIPFFRSPAASIPAGRQFGLSILAPGLAILAVYAWAFAAAYRRWDLFAPTREAKLFLLKTLLPQAGLALLALIQLIFRVC